MFFTHFEMIQRIPDAGQFFLLDVFVCCLLWCHWECVQHLCARQHDKANNMTSIAHGLSRAVSVDQLATGIGYAGTVGSMASGTTGQLGMKRALSNPCEQVKSTSSSF